MSMEQVVLDKSDGIGTSVVPALLVPGHEVVMLVERVYAGNGVFHISTVQTIVRHLHRFHRLAI